MTLVWPDIKGGFLFHFYAPKPFFKYPQHQGDGKLGEQYYEEDSQAAFGREHKQLPGGDVGKVG